MSDLSGRGLTSLSERDPKRVEIADAIWPWNYPTRVVSYCIRTSRRAFNSSGPCAVKISTYSGPTDAVSLSSATFWAQKEKWIVPFSQWINLYRLIRRLTSVLPSVAELVQLPAR